MMNLPDIQAFTSFMLNLNNGEMLRLAETIARSPLTSSRIVERCASLVSAVAQAQIRNANPLPPMPVPHHDLATPERKWIVGVVTRPNAAGILYNAVRFGIGTEYEGEPTHDRASAARLVARLNAEVQS